MGNRNSFCLWGLENFFSLQSKEIRILDSSRGEDILRFGLRFRFPGPCGICGWRKLERCDMIVLSSVSSCAPHPGKIDARPGGPTCPHKILETMGAWRPRIISTALPRAAQDLCLSVSDGNVLLSQQDPAPLLTHYSFGGWGKGSGQH